MAGYALTDGDAPLRWRIERACQAAWRPRARHIVGDWAIGLSGGGTRRTNSASAVVPQARIGHRTLAAVRDIFASQQQPVIFRVTGLTPKIDPILDAADFAPPEATTHTLARRLDTPVPPEPTVILTTMADASWLSARRRFSVIAGSGSEDHVAPLTRSSVPACFARIEVAGTTASVAYAAVVEGMAVIEAVATDPAWRGRGLARASVSALLGWAYGAGADHAALQVVATNAAAIGLYRGLGFRGSLYDYHYRRSRA